jgi:hypothetical protein
MGRDRAKGKRDVRRRRAGRQEEVGAGEAEGRAGAGGEASERAGVQRSGVGRGVAREARVSPGPEDRPGPAERLSVAEFLVRQRAGSLPSGPRAELIGGRVVVPPLPRAVEVAAVVGLASRLEPVLMGRARLEFLPALRLARADLLRPDLALLDASPRFGRGASRPGGDALLVVEVLRDPAGKDLRLPLYARGGVGEVWLLDLERGLAEVYRAPGSGRYGSRTLWYPGEKVGPVALEGVEVELLAPF